MSAHFPKYPLPQQGQGLSVWFVLIPVSFGTGDNLPPPYTASFFASTLNC